MIKFRCKNCGQKISVKSEHAGKQGKCPKCKIIVVIPKIERHSSLQSQSPPIDSNAFGKTSILDSALLDFPKKDNTSNQPDTEDNVFDDRLRAMHGFAGNKKPDETTETATRKLPWPIDIFLYPTSKAGLMVYAIIIVIPLLINTVAILLGPLGFFVSIPGLVIKIVISLYTYWYLCECIRDSAQGGLRAPDILTRSPSLGDMFFQMLKIVGCYIFFAGPMTFYFFHTHRTDVILWLLLAYAVLFFPMGLLAVIMFDSISGLNPLLLLASIFSTFFQYCGLVILLISLSFAFIKIASPLTQSWISRRLFNIVFIYLLMVLAHLLGRFYWRYQEKLYWEV